MEKILQYITSIIAGFIFAFETSLVFFIPCFLTSIVDIISAWQLSRRIKKNYPKKTDGKFKSIHLTHTLQKLFIVFISIIVANYVDVYIIKDTDFSVRFVVAVFLFYEIWSILENWSSANNNKFAKILQQVMINKAERYLQIDIKDILNKKEKEKPKKE